MELSQVDIDRFWSKVLKSKTCWIWSGAKADGYGAISIKGKNEKAHRISYFLKHGGLNKNLELDHLCRNRGCVNPDHLEEVTHKENMLRGIGWTAVNARKTHCPRGHPYDRIDGDGRRRCVVCSRIQSAKSTKKYMDRKRLLLVTQN